MYSNAKKSEETNNEAIAQKVKRNEQVSNSTNATEDNRPEAIAHRKIQAFAKHASRPRSLENKNENRTALPDQLKSGIENLSGYSMDDVKVHYNSVKPAQLNAHAYAQGNQIHLGPGQEKHLPHEAWHVVQQKQGRVKPTRQLKGKVNINDDEGLEKEADVMGFKTLQNKTWTDKNSSANMKILHTSNNNTFLPYNNTLQRYPLYDPKSTKSITIKVVNETVNVYYEENITPNMKATGMNVGHQYKPDPKTIVYVPEIVMFEGKMPEFKIEAQDKLGVKPWFVNDPLSKAAPNEMLHRSTEGKVVRSKTIEGSSNKVHAARLLVWNWVKKHGLEKDIHHQEYFRSKATFSNSMRFKGDSIPDPDSVQRAEEAESDELTGAVTFQMAAMTTALAVHELVHTFFQKPGSKNSRLYEPIIEFIALRILGLHERISPRGSFPYGSQLQGEQPKGGLPQAVTSAILNFRKETEGFSRDDLAVRWAKMLISGETERAYQEYSGEFG